MGRPGRGGDVRRGQSSSSGAALWTERDGVRLRHYLHFSGDLIVRHWVYSARPRGAFGGNSGAAVERRGDSSSSASSRSAAGWAEPPATSRPLGAAVARRADRPPAGPARYGDPARGGGRGGYLIHMRDISEHLIGEERRLGPDELYAVLGAAAGMHREFHGEDVRSATRVEDMLAIVSPATIAREIDEPDLAPKQLPAGWEAFAQAAPDDVAAAVAALLDDPGPLAAALAREGLTLIHGDLRDDNMGVLGNDVFLIDWDLAAMATPGVELVWFLLEDAWRADLSREEIIALALAAEGALLDERGLALGALAGMCTFGWLLGHSAVIHPDPARRRGRKDELAFWTPRCAPGSGAVRTALAALVLALGAAPAAAATCGSTAGVPAFTPGPQPVADEAVSSYLSSVDAASTRVLTGVAGTSVEGRPLPYAIVSSPRNLARLSAIAARARASRQGRSHAAGGPAIVWLAANVHGNEPPGTDADLQLLSDLATARRARCSTGSWWLPAAAEPRRTSGRHPRQRRRASTSTATGSRAPSPRRGRSWPCCRATRRWRSPTSTRRAATSFFFPPDTDPVHHEVPAAALRAMSAHDRPGAAAGLRPRRHGLLDRHGLRPVLHGLRRQRDDDAVRRRRHDVREGHRRAVRAEGGRAPPRRAHAARGRGGASPRAAAGVGPQLAPGPRPRGGAAGSSPTPRRPDDAWTSRCRARACTRTRGAPTSRRPTRRALAAPAGAPSGSGSTGCAAPSACARSTPMARTATAPDAARGHLGRDAAPRRRSTGSKPCWARTRTRRSPTSTTSRRGPTRC